MITKKDIIDTYVFLRKNNHSIPDEVLDFIKDTCIEKIDLIEKENDYGEIVPCPQCGSMLMIESNLINCSNSNCLYKNNW
jgi:exosome complex RNA-binding protein Csl4